MFEECCAAYVIIYQVSSNISKPNVGTERADSKISKQTTAGLSVPAIGYMKQLFRLLTGQPVSSNSSKDRYSGRLIRNFRSLRCSASSTLYRREVYPALGSCGVKSKGKVGGVGASKNSKKTKKYIKKPGACSLKKEEKRAYSSGVLFGAFCAPLFLRSSLRSLRIVKATRSFDIFETRGR
jgi:hypothetical protein